MSALLELTPSMPSWIVSLEREHLWRAVEAIAADDPYEFKLTRVCRYCGHAGDPEQGVRLDQLHDTHCPWLSARRMVKEVKR